MEIVSSMIFYSIKYILFIGVAIAGIFVGKKLRDRKNAKSEN